MQQPTAKGQYLGVAVITVLRYCAACDKGTLSLR